jgi:hypothetical protein
MPSEKAFARAAALLSDPRIERWFSPEGGRGRLIAQALDDFAATARREALEKAAQLADCAEGDCVLECDHVSRSDLAAAIRALIKGEHP